MRHRSVVLLLIVLLSSSASSVIAQDQTAALASSLAQEEQLLGSSKGITTVDISRLKSLVVKIRETKDPVLLSRAELTLVLFTEQERSKTAAAAFNKSIIDEARTIRGYRWHSTKDALVKTGFWTGLSSLGLLGLSQAVGSWAADEYVKIPTVSAATPYFITGQVSQLASTVSIIGAVGGLGMAWLLSINPFDIPEPVASTVIDYPKIGMSKAEKISYLEKTRATYQKGEKRARLGRNASFVFLASGLTGALATGIIGYLGNLEYQKYTSSTTAADATAYRQTVTTYNYLTIGSASLAFVGLTGATIGYLFGTDPAELSSSIDALNSQLRILQEER